MGLFLFSGSGGGGGREIFHEIFDLLHHVKGSQNVVLIFSFLGIY